MYESTQNSSKIGSKSNGIALQGGIMVEIEVIKVGGVKSILISTREKRWNRSDVKRTLW